jgi:hypothetical protein
MSMPGLVIVYLLRFTLGNRWFPNNQELAALERNRILQEYGGLYKVPKLAESGGLESGGWPRWNTFGVAASGRELAR